MRAKQWHVDLYLSEEGDRTKARAVLHGEISHPVVGSGSAVRNPHDPYVPEIGDEVAVGRALEDLAGRMLQIAGRDIEVSVGDRSFRND
jgi:hypothetical protein